VETGVTPPDSSPLPQLVALARAGGDALEPLDALLCHAMHPDAEAENREIEDQLPIETSELLAALVGWAAPYRTMAELGEALGDHRRRLAELRRDDALMTLATAHSTKGLEFDHVAVIGLDAGRFPSARSLRDAPEPARALEEERRLAYVAWTRARKSLTLVYDPASPSQFLREAFSDTELGLDEDAP
jgi:superfamily I DNA/RNA helicase